jgi:hypothetical protein
MLWVWTCIERVGMSCLCLSTGLANSSPIFYNTVFVSRKIIKFKVISSFPLYTVFWKQECNELFYIDGEGPVHYGVCSNYLRDANEGDDINLFVRRWVYRQSRKTGTFGDILKRELQGYRFPSARYWQVDLRFFKSEVWKQIITSLFPKYKQCT